MSVEKHSTHNTLLHWHNFRLKLVFEGLGIGIITGFLVVLYRYLLEKSEVWIAQIYHALQAKPLFILPWLAGLILVGVVVGLLVKAEPMISGSGIPQVEGVLLRKLSMNWWKVILGKFFGGVLAIGAGLSLGREGPSVQLGAAVGQGFSRVFKRIKIEEKYLITCGAGAGLAAAFSAPLAGVMFALEEVHKNFSPLILLSTLASALSADFITREFFGMKPVLYFPNLQDFPLRYYLLLILLGIILGVMGVAFNKTLLKTQDLYARQTWLPKKYWIILPLLVSVLLGLYLPQALGGGNSLIVGLMTDRNFTLGFLLILIVIKFLFTMLCYGSGAPGGIFLPLLSVGALGGCIYGMIVVHLFHLDNTYIANFIILAMAGYFTAIVRAPITGVILITEMTGSFTHLLSLALVSIAAYIIADLLGSKPIYESLLERILHKQEGRTPGNEKTKMITEFAVCMGSMLDGKQIKEIAWPPHCLLVSVKRGEQEIIPKGDTAILAGDYLLVLANDDKTAEINDALLNMVGLKSN